MTHKIVTIPQVDGGLRFIALTSEDAARFARDPALIDALQPLGVVDMSKEGLVKLGTAGPLWSEVPSDVAQSLGARHVWDMRGLYTDLGRILEIDKIGEHVEVLWSKGENETTLTLADADANFFRHDADPLNVGECLLSRFSMDGPE